MPKAANQPPRKRPQKPIPRTKAKRKPPSRPPGYEKAPAAYNELAWSMAARGLNLDQMADKMEVSPATLDRWLSAYPALREAIERGRDQVDEMVTRSLAQRAMGYSHREEKIFLHEGSPVRVETVKHYAPDATSAIFWLKNRRPAEWRDKQEHQVDLRLLVRRAFMSLPVDEE